MSTEMMTVLATDVGTLVGRHLATMKQVAPHNAPNQFLTRLHCAKGKQCARTTPATYPSDGIRMIALCHSWEDMATAASARSLADLVRSFVRLLSIQPPTFW
jgi:hypothetical protein